MAKRRGLTKDDVRELKTLARQKTPDREASGHLAQRVQKTFSLGVSLNTGRGRISNKYPAEAG
jgi:hypothetical protein